MEEQKKAKLREKFKKHLEVKPDNRGKIRAPLTRRKYEGTIFRYLDSLSAEEEVSPDSINKFINATMTESNSFWVRYPFKPFIEMLKEPFKFKLIIKPRAKPAKRTGNYLDDTDLNMIIQNIETPKFKLAALIQKETGCRVSEVLALRGQDIIKDELGDIIIRFWEKKTGKERKVPWRDIESGKDLLELRTKAYLFLPRQLYENDEEMDKSLRNIYRYYWGDIKKAAKKAGFPLFSTHDFRRIMTRLAFRATGNDLLSTQMFMGHASVGTTIKYIGDIQIDKKDIIRKVYDTRSKGESS